MKDIISTITTFARTALRHFVAPPFCAYCKIFLSTDAIFCDPCTARIRPIASATLSVTPKYPVTIFSIANYNYPLKALVLAKRWSHIVAATQLGELIWQMTYIQNVPFDYIVPIPLHWSRFAHRGYNQAEEIAQVLSKKSGKPVAHLLKRSKRTQFQSALPVEQRIGNVHNAFYVPERYQADIRDKHILFVDDLLTTGATLTAATRALMPHKPAKFTAVVACRVV